MVMSWIFTLIVALSVICAMLQGNMQQLSTAVAQGAQSGVTLVISMAGALCLWTGVGYLMEKNGIAAFISRLLRPLLRRLFPSTRKDIHLENCLSANICANLLGLGNAATPMGIEAAKGLRLHSGTGIASDELCRLIVLNTASIQLIPATVAAVRGSLGSPSPFDILPAVWVTSLCSASAGLIAAYILGRLWHT